MVLNRERFFVFDANAFDGIVVQVAVRDDDVVVLFDVGWVYTEAMVLRGDLAATGFNVQHGMVRAAVAVVHLER